MVPYSGLWGKPIAMFYVFVEFMKLMYIFKVWAIDEERSDLRSYLDNIMGDKLLLNLGAKFQP